MFEDVLVLIKGAGDLASGVAWRLHQCGFSVVMTERARPLTVRRSVTFAQAVFAEQQTVEGVTARRCTIADVPDVLMAEEIPVLVDPTATSVYDLAPTVLVDAIMAKTNTGTSLDDAALVVALGPGFTAGVDCHAVVETNRGHFLGRAIWSGSAQADTGRPGLLPGTDRPIPRVLRAPLDGRIEPHYAIGDRIERGATIATVHSPDNRSELVVAPFTGVLRGLIHPSVSVSAGLKIGDLDPRAAPRHCFTISDKSLSVGGGVLEAILSTRAGKHSLD